MAGQELETAVERVEAMFRKADSDIEYLSRKLNDECQQSLDGKDSKVSPLEVMRHIQEAKRELSSLKEDTESISAAQQDMMSQLRGQLTAVTQVMETLQATSGVGLDDCKDEDAIVECLLGFKLTSTDRQSSQERVENQVNSPTETLPSGAGSGPGTPELSPASNKENETPPHEKRLASPEFYPVQESEFQSVSEIIRGRATLAEVNKVYRKLYDHFQSEPDSAPLMIRDMVSMGMRVTGATGQAKLKILRSLKIVSITSKGDVKLLV